MKIPFNTILVLFISVQSVVVAQSNLNAYKYFSVADRFEFLKYSDQYQVNSLTKFLLKKNEFIVLEPSEDYPQDLSSNRCLLANVDVIKVKGFLKTKLEVHFKNCKNEIIYTSDVGVSREKDFRKAYHEALRAAFKSIADLDYSYNTPPASQVISEDVPDQTPQKNLPPAPEVVEIPKSPALVSTDAVRPPPPPPTQATQIKSVSDKIRAFQLKSTSYGFDVIENSTERIIHSLHETMYQGLYIINNLPGMAYKRGNKWVREYISNQKTVIEPLF